jgi:hypothetical protein
VGKPILINRVTLSAEAEPVTASRMPADAALERIAGPGKTCGLSGGSIASNIWRQTAGIAAHPCSEDWTNQACNR